MKKIMLVLAALSLTSCGLIQSRDDQYLHTKPAPQLQVPVGVNNKNLGNDYPIAGDQYPTSNKAVSIVPPESAVDHQ